MCESGLGREHSRAQRVRRQGGTFGTIVRVEGVICAP